MSESHSSTDKNQFKFGIGDIVRFNRLYKDFYVYVADGQYVEITSLDADRGYGMKIVPKHKNSKTMYVPRMFVDACCKKARHRFNVGDVVKFTHEFRNFAGSLKVQCGATAKIKEAYLTGGYVLEFDSGVETPFDPDWVDQHCELHNASHDVNEDTGFSSCKFAKGDIVLFKSATTLMGKVGKIINIIHCANDKIQYRLKLYPLDPLKPEYGFQKEDLERYCVKLPDTKFKIGDIIVCKTEFWNNDVDCRVGNTFEVVGMSEVSYKIRSLCQWAGQTTDMSYLNFDTCEEFCKKLEF